jgi:hypothetical protein
VWWRGLKNKTLGRKIQKESLERKPRKKNPRRKT